MLGTHFTAEWMGGPFLPVLTPDLELVMFGYQSRALQTELLGHHKYIRWEWYNTNLSD